MEITCRSIGKVQAGKEFAVQLDSGYTPGLAGLKGFTHVLVVWYADKMPPWDSAFLLVDKPYRLAPEKLGVFATRSPFRPNGICVSVAEVSQIDEKKGRVTFNWIDAEDGTPVIDLKPYHPSSDRIRDAKTPSWSAHWPACYEESGSFAWDKEFLFL